MLCKYHETRFPKYPKPNPENQRDLSESLPAFEKIFRENREIIENSQKSRKNQGNQEIFKKNCENREKFSNVFEFS